MKNKINILILTAIIAMVLIVGLVKISINTFIMKGDVMTKDFNEVFCMENTCHYAGCNKCILTKLQTNEEYPCSKLYADKKGNSWRQYWTCEDDYWGK